MPDSTPLVSVIVPVYNVEPYLRECLRSILASSVSPLEIIAVDDGSGDSSPAILDEFAQEGRIKVIHQSNGGPSKARNAGLAAATGEYVGFVDADDWIEPTMYGTMVENALKYHADIVQCGIIRNENDRTHSALPSGVYDRERMIKEIYPMLICTPAYHSRHQTLRGSVCCRLFRRQHLQENQICFCEAINNNEDMLFCLKAIQAADCYVCLADDYLYHNRTPQGTLTRRYQPQMWERQQVLIHELRECTQQSSYDFSKQIDYKIFQIAQYSIFFDQAVETPLSRREQVARVRMIGHDKTFRNALGKIDFLRLRPIERAMFAAFRLHLYFLVHWLVAYRSSKRK